MSLRILIADPDKYLLNVYRDYLEQHGFGVLTATSGLECVEKLRERCPDVLVLEPSLPWGGGDGVLAMMHEAPNIPVVPVIILTYGRDHGVLYRITPYPIDDYLVKPSSAEQLAERIRTMDKRRQFEASQARHSKPQWRVVMGTLASRCSPLTRISPASMGPHPSSGT